MKKKIVSLVLVFALALALGIGGTVAWLTAQTQSVVNTFTIGDINIELDETKGTLGADNTRDFKFIPGATLEKDPKVTVLAGSEACYVFVKIVEESNPEVATNEKALTYTLADGWTALDATSGVYWTTVSKADAVAGKALPVLAGDKVTVSGKITETLAESMETTIPKLTFTAYAIQSENLKDNNGNDAGAAAAWALLNTQP